MRAMIRPLVMPIVSALTSSSTLSPQDRSGAGCETDRPACAERSAQVSRWPGGPDGLFDDAVELELAVLDDVARHGRQARVAFGVEAPLAKGPVIVLGAHDLLEDGGTECRVVRGVGRGRSLDGGEDDARRLVAVRGVRLGRVVRVLGVV